MAKMRSRTSVPLAAVLATIVLLVNLALLGLASFEVNRQLNNISSLADNYAVYDLVRFALTGAAVGFASAIIGFIHARSYRYETLVGAVCVAVIALVLLLLATGFSCKHIILGNVKQDRLRALEAFAIVAGGIQLFYVLFLVVELDT